MDVKPLSATSLEAISPRWPASLLQMGNGFKASRCHFVRGFVLRGYCERVEGGCSENQTTSITMYSLQQETRTSNYSLAQQRRHNVSIGKDTTIDGEGSIRALVESPDETNCWKGNARTLARTLRISMRSSRA
ncbi:uncharacterized protein LOC113335980 [Papaver somniferum]|uniref:uncharacterized protein LOC113335980 n=1 Tax=Papaver somniferum TaxID=3469 RepID=UPI000E705426|nr:uncharacterized protein LOC113335980 [Papaver somniferum]